MELGLLYRRKPEPEAAAKALPQFERAYSLAGGQGAAAIRTGILPGRRPRRCRSSNGHTPWPAAKALPQLERAYALAEGRYRGMAAAQAGRAALAAGEQETARAYAEIMLSSNLGTVGAFTTATSPWAAWRWPKETSRKQRVACSRRAEPREAGHSVRSVPTWRGRNLGRTGLSAPRVEVLAKRKAQGLDRLGRGRTDAGFRRQSPLLATRRMFAVGGPRRAIGLAPRRRTARGLTIPPSGTSSALCRTACPTSCQGRSGQVLFRSMGCNLAK